MYINLVCANDHNQIIPHGFQIKSLISALEDLGHSVFFNWMTPVYRTPGLSLVMGPILLVKFHKEYCASLIHSKAPYILHSTEMLREDLSGFNWWERDDFTSEEKALFLALVEHSLSVWTGDHDSHIYKKIKSKVHVPKIGGTPNLAVIRKQRNPPIDVLFFGSMNEKRQRVLSTMQGRGIEVVALGYTDDIVRDQFVSAAKIVVSIHHTPENLPYSIRSCYSHRLIYLAHHGITSVSDYAQARSSEIEQLFVHAPDESHTEVCIEVLKSGLWQDAGLRANRILNKTSLAEQIEPLLQAL